MTNTELLALFRSEVTDLELPYLWSDALVYGYIDEAQKQFCRQTYGIEDARTYKLNITAAVEWYAVNPKILKIRDVVDRATGLDIPMVPIEKMRGHGMRFDGSVGPLKAMITGLQKGFVRAYPMPFTRVVPTDRANSTVYLLGAIIKVVATDGSTRYCACTVSGTTAGAQGALYTGTNTSPILDGSAQFEDRTSQLTSIAELRTFRLPEDLSNGDDFEIDDQHVRNLLLWVKHKAYGVVDSEVYDPKASEKYFQMWGGYCDVALREQSRSRHTAACVVYGGP